jgi:Tetratricopeptide repeat
MFAFFKKIASSIHNSNNISGNNNHILNFVNADSSSFGFDPQIDWNTTPQAGGGFSAQLEWRTRLTPIIGRDAEQRALLDWANDAPQLSFKIIEAPGGTGKTRLAAEVAQTLSETKDWSAGFVQLLDFEKAQRLQWQGNWLIVIDYPEHAPDRLEALFRIAKAGLSQTSAHKLRVLLLCRSQDGIGEKLGASGVKGFLSSQLNLKELPTQDNFVLLTKALAKLMPQKVMSVDKSTFDDWQRQSTLHQTALFVLALALHLSTSPAINQQFLPGKDLLLALVQREKQRWRKAEEGLGLQADTLADVIAIATLFNGLPAADVNTILSQHYSWSKTTADKVLTALAEVWHADNSNATVYPALAPDLLAAVFLWDWQSQASKRGNVQDMAIIAQLIKDRANETVSLLQRWHMHAYDQTMRLSFGQPIDAGSISLLLEKIAQHNKRFALQLRNAFLSANDWPAFSELAVHCSKPQIMAEVDAPSKLESHAYELNNHAIDLVKSGNRAGALLTAQEAMTIYRQLALDNPVAFEPGLAMSVSNLANILSETGDRAGALLAAQEAVTIYRRLALANPAAFEPDLAMCINNLANILSKTGDRAGALLAAQEAVTIRRRLALANPAAFEPVLAGSVCNLGSRLSETGDRAGALLAAQEAAAIYRRLATASPAAFEPDLAMSVSNLALRLNATGDSARALLIAHEALTRYENVNKRYAGLFENEISMTQRLIDFLEKSNPAQT